MSTRWPTKLRRFGITDPILKVLVAKYENEIPWQVEVTDEASLTAFVAGTMLPRHRARVAYPPERGVKHCFVPGRKIDAAAMLETDTQLDEEDREIVALILDEDGAEAAATAFASIVNERKRRAFAAWTALFDEKYADDPGFVALLLRPLLETSGAGTRRTVPPPSAGVVDWLHRRARAGRLTPDDNLARVYTWKLSNGAHRVPDIGWQHIPKGAGNGSRLVAASARSGWCVQQCEVAESHVSCGHFYLLRVDGRAEVAIRTSWDGLQVVECQGRFNEAPVAWLEEIALFARTVGLRFDEARHVPGLPDVSLTGRPWTWWRDRCRLWQFASLLAPDDVRDRLDAASVQDVMPWVEAPFFEALLQASGLCLGRSGWAELVRLDPSRHDRVPAEHRDTPDVLRACVAGWTDRLREHEFTVEDIALISPAVAGDPELVEALDRFLPGVLGKRVRKRPSSARQRCDPFRVEDVLPATKDEPFAVAVERAINALLTRQDAHFGDDVFDPVTLERPDFGAVREAAWYQAVDAQPPLRFALPGDLVASPDFAPPTGAPTRVDLDAWRDKVIAKPWLLTQKRGVPMSIRLRQDVLDAYFEGWMAWIGQRPSRIWVQRGGFTRVYMSYAMLAEPRFPDALADIWREHRWTSEVYWADTSRRMRVMPVWQVALLRSLDGLRGKQMVGSQVRVCCDIASMQNRQRVADLELPYVAEVRQRLEVAGFR